MKIAPSQLSESDAGARLGPHRSEISDQNRAGDNLVQFAVKICITSHTSLAQTHTEGTTPLNKTVFIGIADDIGN